MKRKPHALLKGIRKDQKGATAVEYGLIAALIAAAIIAGASTLGGRLNSTLTGLSNCLSTSATNSSCMN